MAAACTCPAGIGVGGFGNCNHVGGVLFGLEDYIRQGLRDIPSSSCTSKLSSWNVPRETSSNPAPIEEILIAKIKFGKSATDKAPKINIYDPRGKSDRTVDKDSLNQLKHNHSQSVGESCFFLFHDMNPYPPQGVSQPILEEIVDIDVVNCTTTLVEQQVEPSQQPCSFNDHYDISKVQFKRMMDYYAASLSINQAKINAVEKRTRGQSSSVEWYHHRKYKITASNVYIACRNTVEPSCKLKSMFYSSFSTYATKHGSLYEDHVLQLYQN